MATQEENGNFDKAMLSSIYLIRTIESLKGEVFKDILGYEGLYKISNYGRVKALNWKGVGITKIRKLQIDKGGYLRCNLTKNGKNKCFIIHQLVGKHFLDLISDKPHINHIDGNKVNNMFTNLEWCNISDNNNLAYSLGLLSKGGRNPKKITMEDNQGNFKSFNSIKDAILQLKLKNKDYHIISACCNGKRKDFNNCKWSYQNKNNPNPMTKQEKRERRLTNRDKQVQLCVDNYHNRSISSSSVGGEHICDCCSSIVSCTTSIEHNSLDFSKDKSVCSICYSLISVGWDKKHSKNLDT